MQSRLEYDDANVRRKHRTILTQRDSTNTFVQVGMDTLPGIDQGMHNGRMTNCSPL